MQYRQLGKSDLRVSAVSFGCMSLGTDQAMNERLLHRAMDEGINLFDTADLYDRGANEASLGKALSGGRRAGVLLATKVGNQWRPDGSGWDWNPTKPYMLRSVEDSLRRLQTDYIDLYQLHGGTIGDPIDETIDAFETLRAQGKIRYYGISSIRPNVIREYVQRSQIVSVMMQYSLLDRRPEETCLDLLAERGQGVLARGSLAKGLLAGKPVASYLNHAEESVRGAQDAVAKLVNSERNASAIAVQFVLHHPAVATAVVGIRTPEQLEAAIRAGSAAALTEAEIQQLRSVVPVNVYEEHR